MADEDDDYESLPETSSASTHMIAGAAAGVMEHCVMYPLDCVKTRMQVLVPDPRANYRNIIDALVRIVRHEGIARTVRGINVTAYGAGPAHAMYFACYEKMKGVLSRTGQSNHWAHGVAGSCATVLHDAVMNPAEVIKQRMQVFGSPYRNWIHCFRSVYAKEGPVAFYRSYGTQLSMNIPFQSLHFVIYEFSQDLLNRERHYDPKTHVVSGGLAGAVAAAATTPLDVCKTLLNTQEKCAHVTNSNGVSGFVEAFRTVYRFRGVKGFFSGVTARVLYQMPSTAISWSVYEFFKAYITKQKLDSSTETDFKVDPSSVVRVRVQATVAD